MCEEHVSVPADSDESVSCQVLLILIRLHGDSLTEQTENSSPHMSFQIQHHQSECFLQEVEQTSEQENE